MSQRISIGLLILIVMSVLVIPRSMIHAAALTNVSDTMTRLQQSTDSNHVIAFTTATSLAAAETIKIQFDPAGDAFTLKGTLTNADMTGSGFTVVAGCGGGASEVTATVDTSAPDENITLTVCSGDTVAAGAKSLTITNNEITNPSSANTYEIEITTTSDSGSLAVVIVSDDTVNVSATVDPSLTFSISDTTIGFATLSSSASRWATGDLLGNAAETEAHTLIAGTNATSGYSITLNGATLTSVAADTITAIGANNTAPSTGSEQFGVRYTASGGSGAVSAPYAAAGYAFDTAAFPDEIAAATGPSANTTYSARYLANIASNTEAGTYTADLTYIATATF
ncbi:MAG: hypothetical protein HZC01_03410 [Candidatus Kerfeldbacteria bacterium]|nr:hypothetical protein [Candidatus Kerfeldbacteria bacterium]